MVRRALDAAACREEEAQAAALAVRAGSSMPPSSARCAPVPPPHHPPHIRRNNENLNRLATKLESGLIFAHVRAAYPGMPVSEQNCHPFQWGRYMFMHNGVVAGFMAIRRELLATLRDAAYNAVQSFHSDSAVRRERRLCVGERRWERRTCPAQRSHVGGRGGGPERPAAAQDARRQMARRPALTCPCFSPPPASSFALFLNHLPDMHAVQPAEALLRAVQVRRAAPAPCAAPRCALACSVPGAA
jgi:hypothetical protein